MFISLIVSLTLLPALISVFPPNPATVKLSPPGSGALGRVLEWPYTHARAIWIGAALLALGSLALALALTPVCMLLFGDLLNLTIPMLPDSLMALFPAGWSQKAMLRASSAAMLAIAALLFFSGARSDANDAKVTD